MKALFLTLALSLNAFAVGPSPEEADQLDTAREGNLRNLVIQEFAAKYKAACPEEEGPKFEAIKLASGSYNQSKTPGTRFNFEATYLVIQKCLAGSTFQGAFTSLVKSSIMKGSFTALADRNERPTKVKDLKYEFVSDVTLPVPKN
jgi:hypothetical protein